MFTLIKNATVYTPENIGCQDILLAGEKVAFIKPDLQIYQSLPDVDIIDASGCSIVPGFIDSHVHIAGGGGEGGPATRTPPINLNQLISAGITTVIGLLGVDGVTRSVQDLLATARALEAGGITAYIYTGAYEIPTRTITENIRSDLVLIDKIIGVGEIAISDHRSAQPTVDMLAKVAAEARVGGLLGNKAGVVHLHVGEGKRRLELLFQVLEQSDIPSAQFVTSHVNRLSDLFRQSINFLAAGGNIDLTAGMTPDSSLGSLEVSKAIEILVSAKADFSRVTVSSDGNGSLPQFDEFGNLRQIDIGDVEVLWNDIRHTVLRRVLPLGSALALITKNPAAILKLLPQKGTIQQGSDADLVILNDQLIIETVIARGKVLWDKGIPISKDYFA